MADQRVGAGQTIEQDYVLEGVGVGSAGNEIARLRSVGDESAVGADRRVVGNVGPGREQIVAAVANQQICSGGAIEKENIVVRVAVGLAGDKIGRSARI